MQHLMQTSNPIANHLHSPLLLTLLKQRNQNWLANAQAGLKHLERFCQSRSLKVEVDCLAVIQRAPEYLDGKIMTAQTPRHAVFIGFYVAPDKLQEADLVLRSLDLDGKTLPPGTEPRFVPILERALHNEPVALLWMRNGKLDILRVHPDYACEHYRLARDRNHCVPLTATQPEFTNVLN